ncbi:hypothetical protein C4J89_2836 [Pseudomonas sp. R4-35-07]|nr:hypothetical protein C4J89_2836 [Pseudomonas sp. R4-35-07]
MKVLRRFLQALPDVAERVKKYAQGLFQSVGVWYCMSHVCLP